MSKRVVKEEIIEQPAGEEETRPELEMWLLDVTRIENLVEAKKKVEHALQVQEAFPKIGMVTLMVGPGGLLNILVQQNLLQGDSLDDIEAAVLDVQRNLLQLRKQQKAAE